MSQTSYSEQAAAFAGLLADITDGMQKVTGLNAEASAELPFGYFVTRSAAPTGVQPQSVKLPSTNTDDLAGCIIHSHEYDKRLDLGLLGVLPKRQVNVLRRGSIWCVADKAVLQTDKVWVRVTAAGLQLPGMVSNAADGGKCMQLYGARFITETTSLGIVQVTFDMAAHDSYQMH